MSPLYTRTGDQGTTSLLDGSRRSKADLRFEAIGSLDELNTQIGVVRAGDIEAKLSQELTDIQNKLFTMGAYLANPDSPAEPPFSAQQITRVEQQIDGWVEQVPKLTHFILPGGSHASAQLHVARAVCRRAERALVRYHNQQVIHEVLLQYVNRLADYFFAAARAAAQDGAKETQWKGLV